MLAALLLGIAMSAHGDGLSTSVTPQMGGGITGMGGTGVTLAAPGVPTGQTLP